jgi:hypothetical protein
MTRNCRVGGRHGHCVNNAGSETPPGGVVVQRFLGWREAAQSTENDQVMVRLAQARVNLSEDRNRGSESPSNERNRVGDTSEYPCPSTPETAARDLKVVVQ